MSLVQTACCLPQASRAIQHIRFRSRTMTQLVLSHERETFLDDNPARIDGGYGRQVNHLEPSLIFSAAIGSGYHMVQPLGTDSSDNEFEPSSIQSTHHAFLEVAHKLGGRRPSRVLDLGQSR
jgi:hypothetical protein